MVAPSRTRRQVRQLCVGETWPDARVAAAEIPQYPDLSDVMHMLRQQHRDELYDPE